MIPPFRRRWSRACCQKTGRSRPLISTASGGARGSCGACIRTCARSAHLGRAAPPWDGVEGRVRPVGRASLKAPSQKQPPVRRPKPHYGLFRLRSEQHRAGSESGMRGAFADVLEPRTENGVGHAIWAPFKTNTAPRGARPDRQVWRLRATDRRLVFGMPLSATPGQLKPEGRNDRCVGLPAVEAHLGRSALAKVPGPGLCR